jgi:hypothetical protein
LTRKDRRVATGASLAVDVSTATPFTNERREEIATLVDHSSQSVGFRIAAVARKSNARSAR